MRRTFAHPRIVDALTFQPLYLGTSPLRAPALYAMLAVEEIVGGVWYAPGGTGAIVDALVAAARAHGVTFAFGERVVEIATERGRARAARTTAQTYDADAVVVTADREGAIAPSSPPTARAADSATATPPACGTSGSTGPSTVRTMAFSCRPTRAPRTRSSTRGCCPTSRSSMRAIPRSAIRRSRP